MKQESFRDKMDIPYNAIKLYELSLFTHIICDGDERAVKIDLSIDANNKAFSLLRIR